MTFRLPLGRKRGAQRARPAAAPSFDERRAGPPTSRERSPYPATEAGLLAAAMRGDRRRSR
jgi:hypothetical protein